MGDIWIYRCEQIKEEEKKINIKWEKNYKQGKNKREKNIKKRGKKIEIIELVNKIINKENKIILKRNLINRWIGRSLESNDNYNNVWYKNNIKDLIEEFNNNIIENSIDKQIEILLTRGLIT